MTSLFLGLAAISGFGCVVLAVARRPRAAVAASTVLMVALIGATTRLVWAISKLDYSFTYIAEQSRARSGSAYRLAALWGGAEGSLLFFATLASVALVVAGMTGDARRWGLAVPAAAVTILALSVALFANPFARAELPAIRGDGLTPILEHPAMLYHPPILYLGLVATLIPFALVIGAPRLDEIDLVLVRRWTLVAWTLLVIGLATGANWAYVELGWGGYWAWDPVENTVLMPWLLLTAAVHLLRSPEIRDRLPRTTVAVMLAPFPFVLFGTAVTRSGGLSSVHAFADSQALGWMLGLLALVGAAVSAARVVAEPGGSDPRPQLNLRQWVLGAAMILPVFMTVVVLLGVAVPLVPGSNRVVTADFYNLTGLPILVVGLLAIALMAGGTRRQTIRRRAASAAGLVIAVAAGLVTGVGDWLVLVALGLGAAIVVGHVVSASRPRLATVVGHIGFVVLALGIAGSANAQVTATVLGPGETAQFGSDLELRYDSFVVTDGPRPQSEAITVQTTVSENSRSGDPVVMTPGLVSYPDRAVVLAETALHSTPRRDIQVVLRTITDDGLASFELAQRPLQMFVWWGAVLIALSGAIASLKHSSRNNTERVPRTRSV